eukprot:1306946-Rhodomonas_salina.2
MAAILQFLRTKKTGGITIIGVADTDDFNKLKTKLAHQICPLLLLLLVLVLGTLPGTSQPQYRYSGVATNCAEKCA